MKLLVDLTDLIKWDKPHFTGIQRVVNNLAISLKRSENVIFTYYNNDLDEFCELSRYEPEKRTKDGIEGEAIDLSGNIIVLLGASWNTPDNISKIIKSKKKSQFKVAHFIHDISPITVPQYHKKHFYEVKKSWVNNVEKISDYLIFNSTFTQNEFFDNFPACKGIASLTIPLSSFPTKSKPIKPKTVSPPYVLSVGTIEPRKNYHTLYLVWKSLIRKGFNVPKLIIVGSKGWNDSTSYNLLTRDPELRNYITVLEGIEDLELKWLYENCKFTIFPSFYEGWGLPISESLTSNKFCICSNQASMKEVGNNFTDFFHPLDTEKLLRLINKYWNSPEALKSKEDLIVKSYSEPSWEQLAEKLHRFLT